MATQHSDVDQVSDLTVPASSGGSISQGVRDSLNWQGGDLPHDLSFFDSFG